MCLVTFKAGALLHCCASPPAQHPMKRTGCYDFYFFPFLQTLLPYAVREVYKIFIPFLCKTSKKCHFNSGWDDQCIYYSIWYYPESRWWLEVCELPLLPLSVSGNYISELFFSSARNVRLRLMLSCCSFWDGDSCVHLSDMEEQFGCLIIHSFSLWPPFLPLIHTQLTLPCVHTEAHRDTHTQTFYLTDWQWQWGALPHQDMVQRNTKLQIQSAPKHWGLNTSLCLSLCKAQPHTFSQEA